MEASRRVCKKCKKQKIVHDELGNSVCESCGTVQDFDNFQAHFGGGIDGFTGTVVRIGSSGDPFGGDFNYKENKIYHAKNNIEDITMKLGLSSLRSNDVIRMIEQVTEGEYGQGNWFPILIGACSYVVMRKEKNQSLAMAEVASVVGCELHELGRMVIRVVDFLNLDLPEFDIVSCFERTIRNSPSIVGVSDEMMDKMIKQGRFLLQCLVKWFLTTGRQPTPVVVAVLVFVAELNQLQVTIEQVANEIHAGVATSRLRYKELQKTLVQVAQALPWGNNVTVKNITKNAPLIIQYMEMKSRLKPSEKKKKKKKRKRKLDDEGGGFDLDEMLSGCLRKDVEYGSGDCSTENDAPYFEVEDRNGNRQTGFDELNALKISQECLSRIYTEFSNYRDSNKSKDTIGETHSRKKKKKGPSLWESKEWWAGKSDLCRKLSLEQILTKNVGLSCLPPSFVSGTLACKRRREKINAAKLRIKQIMQPADTKKDDLQVGNAGNVDWEDCIIELLLLHQVKEEELEQGHYNRLVDLHVFNPVSPSEMFAQTQSRRGK